MTPTSSFSATYSYYTSSYTTDSTTAEWNMNPRSRYDWSSTIVYDYAASEKYLNKQHKIMRTYENLQLNDKVYKL